MSNSIFNLPDVDGSQYHPDVFIPQLGDAPSGYGSTYDQLFAANPYRNLQYKESFAQKIAKLFGFRTGADKFAEQSQLNAAEYDAGIFSQMAQDKFNSPASMAQRERDAGMNPDLLGIGDVATAAGPLEDPNGMQPSEDEVQSLQVVGGFIRGIYNAFVGGMSMYKDFLGVKEMQNVIDNGNISKARSMVELVDETIVGAYSRHGSLNDDVQRTAIETSMLESPEMYMPFGLSKGARRDFTRYLSQRLQSIKNDAKVREYYLSRANNIAGANRAEASGFIPSPEDYEGEVQDAFIATLASTARDIELQLSKNQLAGANVEVGEIVNRGISANIENQRLDTLNDSNFGALKGHAEAAEVGTKLSVEAYRKIVADNKEKFYAGLKIMSEQFGNPVARVVLLQMALQDLVQFEASGSLDLNLLKGLSSLVSGIASTGELRKFNEGTRKSNGFGLSGEISVRTK